MKLRHAEKQYLKRAYTALLGGQEARDMIGQRKYSMELARIYRAWRAHRGNMHSERIGRHEGRKIFLCGNVFVGDVLRRAALSMGE